MLFLFLDWPSGTHRTTILRLFDRLEHYLASCMTDIQQAFLQRRDPSNHLPHVFSSKVTACVDTFPVFIQKPRRTDQLLRVYQGKFKRPVLKFQVERYLRILLRKLRNL